MTALKKIMDCLEAEKDFVLQGGAGSGKTETLKDILSHIALSYPKKNVACITLTNKAADEIKSRVGDIYDISTIHSFLHSLIDPYRDSIKTVIDVVFLLEPLSYIAGAEHEIAHDVYKKRYEKFATTQYRFSRIKTPKPVYKPVYEKDPKKYVIFLSEEIKKLNSEIMLAIAEADSRKMRYNQSSFDNIRSFTYGHDGLLKIAAALLERFPTLQRILGDRYDFLFVDEYQDTSPDIIRVLIDVIAVKTNTTIGLFGDSMQGIYEDGVGDVENYIKSASLVKIEKEDNFRCSEQVVDFLNTLRLDTLKQKVAFKSKINGEYETIADRQGVVNFYYAIAPVDAKDDKATYLSKLKSLVTQANLDTSTKHLMLTNRSIAGEVGFVNLYDIFTDRYNQERGEEMERILCVLQFDELTRICTLHKSKEYNELITLVKKGGFPLNSIKDKQKLNDDLNSIVNSNQSPMATLEMAFAYGFLAKSEAYESYIEYKIEFLNEIKTDSVFQNFLADIAAGFTTAIKMEKSGREMDEYLFKNLKNKKKKKDFYDLLFGDGLKFSEIVNYFDYLNDEKPYVTMHKTKGTGIENVVVVVDEYYWRDYNFKNVLTNQLLDDQSADRKLVYVACSRAINNLTCVRLISEDEEEAILASKFSNITKVDYMAL